MFYGQKGLSSSIPSAPWRRRQMHLDRWRSRADTREVMEKKEKKEVNIETMNNKFAAVKTIENILIGLSILMCVDVRYRPFRQQV